MKIIRWILGRIILIIDFVTRPKKIIRSEEENNYKSKKLITHLVIIVYINSIHVRFVSRSGDILEKNH